jgi:hypothetical protein
MSILFQTPWLSKSQLLPDAQSYQRLSQNPTLG